MNFWRDWSSLDVCGAAGIEWTNFCECKNVLWLQQLGLFKGKQELKTLGCLGNQKLSLRLLELGKQNRN